MKTALRLVLALSLVASAAACSPSTGSDTHGGVIGGKADGEEVGFKDFYGILSDTTLYRRPSIAVRFEVPSDEISREVTVVDAEAGLGKPLQAMIDEKLAPYAQGAEGPMMAAALDAMGDADFVMANGDEARDALIKLIDTDRREDMKTLLSVTNVVRFSINDTSSEMVGFEYFLIDTRADDAEGRAIAIKIDYSEVY